MEKAIEEAKDSGKPVDPSSSETPPLRMPIHIIPSPHQLPPLPEHIFHAEGCMLLRFPVGALEWADCDELSGLTCDRDPLVKGHACASSKTLKYSQTFC